ncbi:unnamed protein product [Merluccius merluccius]
METWRCHIRAELVQRDGSQRDPYAGVFRSLSELQEQFEVRQQIWEDVQSPRVSRYRQEALSLARGSNTMKATLNQQEFTLERQAKELSALQKEHTRLREGMVEAWKEKGELLQRWMEEKKEEAARVNKYNDAQERWRRLARRLKKQLRGETVKSSEVTEVNMTNGGKEAISKLE